MDANTFSTLYKMESFVHKGICAVLILILMTRFTRYFGVTYNDNLGQSKIASSSRLDVESVARSVI